MRVALLLLAASSAHADNALQARVEAEAGKSWLELDPVVAPGAMGVVVSDRRETRDTIALGKHTALALLLEEWANKEGAIGYRDVRGQGWQASARLSRDLGWAQFTVTAAIGDVDTRYARGRYTDVGASLLHTVRRSKGRIGWLGLTVGRRKWEGIEPPPGETNNTQLMLVIGTTF